MNISSPEYAILSWLESCEQNVAFFLVRNYIYMMSHKSDDFVLDDAESLAHFRCLMTQTDLPQRRVARVLCVRTLFSFVFDYSMQETTDEKTSSIQLAHYLKAHQHWQRLVKDSLSDDTIAEWLRQLESC